jgi:hypothetical protein
VSILGCWPRGVGRGGLAYGSCRRRCGTWCHIGTRGGCGRICTLDRDAGSSACAWPGAHHRGSRTLAVPGRGVIHHLSDAWDWSRSAVSTCRLTIMATHAKPHHERRASPRLFPHPGALPAVEGAVERAARGFHRGANRLWDFGRWWARCGRPGRGPMTQTRMPIGPFDHENRIGGLARLQVHSIANTPVSPPVEYLLDCGASAGQR